MLKLEVNVGFDFHKPLMKHFFTLIFYGLEAPTLELLTLCHEKKYWIVWEILKSKKMTLYV